MATKGTTLPIADGSQSMLVALQANAAAFIESTVKLGGEIAHNIAYKSPTMYLASGMAFVVTNLLPALKANPLHAALFVGTAIVAHSVVEPVLKRIIAGNDEITEGQKRLINICNTLALTALVAYLFGLKIAALQGIALTAATYVVAKGVISAAFPATTTKV